MQSIRALFRKSHIDKVVRLPYKRMFYYVGGLQQCQGRWSNFTHFVYFMFDKECTPLYVGMTVTFVNRMIEHAHLDKFEPDCIVILPIPSRKQDRYIWDKRQHTFDIETRLIRAIRPIFNVANNGNEQRQKYRVNAYLDGAPRDVLFNY